MKKHGRNKEMKFSKKSLLTTAGAVAFSAALCIAGANTAMAEGEYLPGDFHQHTTYTDGSHWFTKMMEENNNYLEWWANSEHGGSYKTDGEGVKWLDYPTNPILGDNPSAGSMYRWQSLRDYVYPQIETAREDHLDKTIISGLEWNVPGHEHCSTAIYQPGSDKPTAISEFEYRFDKSDKDTSRTGEAGLLGDTLSKTNSSSKANAIAAVEWMEALYQSGKGDAWVVPAHVERARSYTIEDFRNWMDAGKDVAIGFEGQPGHQVEKGRGGFGGSAVGGGTYGGSGFYVAKVGGLWDALSAEGRKYFNFASSDCHYNWSFGGGDFWPGEYQKNYTYIDVNANDPIQAVFDGNRSGNSWTVMGDLIDKLIFTVEKADGTVAMMGETLDVAPGEEVTVKILMRDPKGTNNCPLNMDNPSLAQIGVSQPLSMPKLDHVDMITGSITGNVPTTAAVIENTDYQTDASVAMTFNGSNWKANKNGVIQVKYTMTVDNDMFIRLRGTNMPANVPNETDEAGNPLLDTLAVDNIYGNLDKAELEGSLFDGVEITSNSSLQWVAAAYADLWFISNPIYIEVK